MANLERLPTELIEMITNYLEYSIDLCSLSQTSRCLYWKTTIEADRHIIQGPEITEIGGNPLDVDEELGRSPLHLAARSGNEFCIRRILAAGYPANPRNEEMEDPVILAAKAGHTETLRLLLENGADPNTTQPISLNGMASNPLLAALSNGHEPAVRLLIDHGARLENNDDDVPVEQPLHAAVRKGNPSLVQLLLEKGCNPMKGLGEPWRWPAALRCDLAAALEHDSGHGVEIILMLVNAGIKPDFSGEDYPHHNRLINALERGDFARFKYLSSHGAELDILPNPADNFSQWDSMPTLFKIAYAPGIHPEEAEWLMALINIDAIIQANKPRQMSNLILGALVGGAESLLRRLLKIEGQPKDPIHQVKDQKDHLTKHLSIAARHGHINIVKLLLDHGADPQGLPDSYVQTPLSAAVERANTEIVKILLDLGAKPRRGDGNKFLYSAISYAHDVKARRKLLLLLVERDLIVQEDTDVRNIIEFAVAAGGESFHLLLEHVGAGARLDDPLYESTFLSEHWMMERLPLSKRSSTPDSSSTSARMQSIAT
ncbi:unnamed protein product [Penicillium salamii]|nr:unnamed protein product [Penicillium salamii]